MDEPEPEPPSELTNWMLAARRAPRAPSADRSSPPRAAALLRRLVGQRRLVSLYQPGPAGLRAAMGGDPRWREHPAFSERLLFYEYFHDETGAGLGASHQTGWTALIANLIDELHRPSRSHSIPPVGETLPAGMAFHGGMPQ